MIENSNLGNSLKFPHSWIPDNLTNEKSILDQVIAGGARSAVIK